MTTVRELVKHIDYLKKNGELVDWQDIHIRDSNSAYHILAIGTSSNKGLVLNIGELVPTYHSKSEQRRVEIMKKGKNEKKKEI